MNKQLSHGSLFSGIGGFELGAKWAGINTTWNCEILDFNRSILRKYFADSTQFCDIKHLNNPPYVDIISGGFPCQDISIAGKGEGIKGKKSSLWSEMWRICREVRPSYIVIENSPMLLVRGFERVLCDLFGGGYYAEWQCLSGTDIGVQQNRKRLYCIAYSPKKRHKRQRIQPIFQKQILQRQFQGIHPGWRKRWDIPQPRTIRSLNDIPKGMDRIGAVGNAVMPKMAKFIFECIKEHHTNSLKGTN